MTLPIPLVTLNPGAIIARNVARFPEDYGAVFRSTTLVAALAAREPAIVLINGQQLTDVTTRLEGVLSRPALRAGLTRHLSLAIDASGEGFPLVPEYLARWHALFDEHGIPPGRVAYLTHNERAPAAMRTWLRESERKAGIRVLLHHPFLHVQSLWVRRDWADPKEQTRRVQAALTAPDEVSRKALFLCLNNKPHAHRMAIVGRILGGDLAARTMLSFGGATKGIAQMDMAPILKDARQLLPRFARDFDALDARLTDLPLTIPGDGEDDVVFGMPEALYGRALMSLVAETNFIQAVTERFTEKSVKALAAGHPIILAALPGTLRLLRGVGFATFDPYIDEGYDGIANPQDRLDALLAEAERIAGLSEAECAALLRRCLPAMEHNMRHAAEALPELMHRRLWELGRALVWMAQPPDG